MNDMSQELVDPPMPSGPGRHLREAREAKNMSLEEAALRLRLHERLVVAIEEDDYEKLPPPAFVIGYLRNYARLLELPQEEVLSSYSGYQVQKPELVPRMRADREVRSSDLFVRLFTWLIILGLIALPAAWWFSQRAELRLGGGEVPADQQPGQPLFPFGVAPAAPAEDSSMGQEPAEMAAAPVAEEEMPATAQAEETPPAETAPAVVDAVPVPAAPGPVPASSGMTDAQHPQPAAESEARPAAAVAAHQLRLEFKADSWARVTDAGGKRLLADLVRAGNSRVFEGQPPYEVTLGYAPGVEVYLGGKLFDHSAFNRKNIAKFSLGQAAGAAGGEGAGGGTE